MKTLIKFISCTLVLLCLAGCANQNIILPTETAAVSTNPQMTEATEATNESTIVTIPQEATESTEPIIEEDLFGITPLAEIDDNELVYIEDYLPDVTIDLKYATTDNFTGKQIYEIDMKPQLRAGTMKKLVEAQSMLLLYGCSLVIWDAYRPVEAQYKLWEAYPDSKYVANPNTGYSSHSKGNTVDITIETLDGQQLEMPTQFDDFSKLADRDYSDVSDIAQVNSTLLESVMTVCGFKPYSAEWWHFSDEVNYDVIEN